MPERKPAAASRHHVVPAHQFMDAMSALKTRGGTGQLATQQAAEIFFGAFAGACGQHLGNTTNHGESRIKHCIKYDLAGRYRLITIQNGNLVYLAFLGTHEDAEHWLEQHRGMELTVDNDSQKLAWVHRPDPTCIPPPRVLTDKPDERLLDMLRGDEVDLLFTPRAAVKAAHLTPLSNDDAFQAVIEEVDTEEKKHLALGVLLALRSDDLDEAARLLELGRGHRSTLDEAPDLVEEAFSAPINSGEFPDISLLSAADLEHLLKARSFQEWMLYLKPDQRPTVAAAHIAPMVLRGVSGSGKTSVLVHRAKHLASLYPDRRILVTTINPALATLIASLIEMLCPQEQRARIDVLPVGMLCRRVIECFEPGCQIQEYDPRSRETLEDNWKESFERPEQQRVLDVIVRSLKARGIDSARYIREEFQWIRSAFTTDVVRGSRLQARNLYVDPQRAPRKGRAVGFSASWRGAILRALEFYESWLDAGRFCDAAAIALRAHRYIGRISGEPRLRYRAVLVDEVQDFGNVELELVRALAPDDVNGLFLTGDHRQQVFPKDHNMRAMGIVPGTWHTFTRNYRNTREILEAGVDLIERFGMSDDSSEELEVLNPEFSARSSARPLVVTCRTWDHEAEFAAWYVGERRRLSDHPIAIVPCGVRDYDEEALRTVCARYQALGLHVEPLYRNSVLEAGKTFVSALETVKGFEFSLVIITQCSRHFLPLRGLPEEEWWRDARRLYVALTRARDEVLFTYAGTPSPFLDGIRERLLWRDAAEEGFESLQSLGTPHCSPAR